jgi:hypothetical protein
MELVELTEGYLKAEGYDVGRKGRDQLIGSRVSVGGDREFIYVWLPNLQDPRAWPSQEGPYMSRFGEAASANPAALKYMLVPSLEGLSNEFRRDAQRWYNVRIRVPVQFFDTPYTWEESPETPSAAKELQARGEKSLLRRALQPFSTESGNTRDDILDTLFNRLRQPSAGRSIHLVIGPAGIGKSFLFECLFSSLYKAFSQDKNAQRMASRPFPLLPAEYVRNADAQTVRAILRAALQSDFVRPQKPEVFDWMLTNGFVTWLIDGLDEIIGQDPAFLDDLLGLMTMPGVDAQPRVLICLRDSVLASSDELREFCEEYSYALDMYRLEKWGDPSKQEFARIELKNDADRFLRAIQSNRALNDLASTPYYCHLLSEQFKTGSLKEVSEQELLQLSVASVIDRDCEKGFIDKAIISNSDVVDFVRAVAAEDFENGFLGVSVDEAKQLAEISLPTGLQENELKGFLSRFAHLGFFSQAGMGQIRFAQEILEHYLLGEWLADLFRRDPRRFLYRLGIRQIPADWVTLRIVAEYIKSENKQGELVGLVHQAGLSPVAFKNAVQLAAMAGSSDEIRQVVFERRDLSAIVFEGLNFEDMSFRGADLSDTEFRNCVLRGIDLEEAVLNNTAFLDSDLQGAKVGSLTRFYSLRVRRETISDQDKASRWFEQRIGAPVRVVQPCPAALQVRHLFGKFIRPNGQARRDWLDMKGVSSGKRYITKPEEAVEASVRYGYLIKEEGRNRLNRPTGDNYSEMVSFVKDLRLAPGLRSLLDEVCDREGCQHVPLLNS